MSKLNEAIALLKEADKVLGRYWYTVVDDGEYAEDFNNDDVIELNEKIADFLAPKQKES